MKTHKNCNRLLCNTTQEEMAASFHTTWLNTIAHACILQNGRLYIWPSKEGVLNLLQRRSFRENPTNFFTFVVRRVRDSVFRTNRRSIGEM